MMATLVFSDNQRLLTEAVDTCKRRAIADVDFACSPNTSSACDALARELGLRRFRIRSDSGKIAKRYELVISLHCRQIFPPELIRSTRCVNFHPGLNPHNRGWFPHVFSMMNGKPAGITIHEMDEEVDHGPIIYQEPVAIYPHETSSDVYQRIIAREIELFDTHIECLIAHEYTANPMPAEGNYNSKQDFESLRLIDLERSWTARGFLTYLRAMTFEGYRNAYFVDEHTGVKCYVTVAVDREDSRDPAP